jgi:glycerol-3-phosphate acyltransferase PlsX
MSGYAIEATGGDLGFEVALAGAKKALSSNPNLELILVAGEDKLRQNKEIESKLRLISEGTEGNKYILDGISIETSFYTYDSETKSKKLQSSIYKVMEMHKSGEVEAVIAPGDTRGAVFSAMRILGLIPGVLSPAIPTHWPNNNVLIDSGSNPRAKPENLYQAAIMGHVFSKYYLGVTSPLIALISNGHENAKGNEIIWYSDSLIKKLADQGYNLSPHYFEGDFFKDLDAGRVAVVDGFIGNILLKGCEGITKQMSKMIKEEVANLPWYLRIPAMIGLKRPFERIKKLSYESYSAAPLLGVEGNVMICHGKSDEKAIENAIYITDKYVKCNVNEKLREEIGRFGEPPDLKKFINQ